MSIHIPPVFRHMSGKRVLIPVFIGLAVALFLVYRDFDFESYQQLHWSWRMGFWILMSLVMMVFRDLGYMIRLRLLSDNFLTWRNAFEVEMLWEFSSAVTPSAIGGTAVALFIMAKEKIDKGRSTAIVLMTSLFDELFFILMVPVIFVIIGPQKAFPQVDPTTVQNFFYGKNLVYLFSTGYLILFAYTIFLIMGLLLRPQMIKRLLYLVFSFSFLRKWRKGAIDLGNGMIITSREYRKKSLSFWIKTFGATVLSWSARYFMVNCLILAFISSNDQLLIYGRQLVMWIILLISPTPGGSGIAEVIFPVFLGEFLPYGLPSSVAFLWRLLSYYPYLIIGAIVLPRWLRRVFKG